MWASIGMGGGDAPPSSQPAGSSKRKTSKKSKREDGGRGGRGSSSSAAAGAGSSTDPVGGGGGPQDSFGPGPGLRRTSSGTILPDDVDLDTVPIDMLSQTVPPGGGGGGDLVLSPDLQAMVDEGALTMKQAMEFMIESGGGGGGAPPPDTMPPPSRGAASSSSRQRPQTFQSEDDGPMMMSQGRASTKPSLHQRSRDEDNDIIPIPGADGMPPQGTYSQHSLPPQGTLDDQQYPSLPPGGGGFGHSPMLSRENSMGSGGDHMMMSGGGGGAASLGNTRSAGRSSQQRQQQQQSMRQSAPQASMRQQQLQQQQLQQQQQSSSSSRQKRSQPSYGRQTTPQQQQQQEYSDDEPRGAASSPQQSSPAPAGGFTGGRLRLRVLRAANLRNTALGVLPDDVSDPFVVAKVGRQEFKTDVIQNSLNPTWNSRHFEFAIQDEGEALDLEVFNAQQWHAHDSLGRAQVPIVDLVPGKKEVKRVALDEAGAYRDDDRSGSLEVEVLFLTTEQLAGGGAAMAGYDQQTAVVSAKKEKKVKNWVPLPNFSHLGPSAVAAPKPEAPKAVVGEQRRLMGTYYSRACRLGQYDYSKEPDYNPNQEDVDKRGWRDDPFYGWRREIARTENAPMLADGSPGRDDEDDVYGGGGGGGGTLARRGGGSGGRERGVLVERNDHQDLDVWRKDPFHGWLKTDKEGHPENNIEKEQEARVARQLKSLPSFRDSDRRRFDDHREYATTREAAEGTRGRWSDESQQQVGNHSEKRWKEDAFFGWLPGRGPDARQEHVLQRPLHLARDKRLPSFSEAPDLLGVAGRPEAIGILSVWINGAFDLRYDSSSGLRGKPSSCVKISVGATEKVTPTVPMDSNPCWSTPAMTFEVQTAGDSLLLEVCDLANPRSEDHMRQYFLGRIEMGLDELQERGLVPGHRVRVREALQGAASRDAEIDFEVTFEPYDDGSNRQGAPQAKSRSQAQSSRRQQQQQQQSPQQQSLRSPPPSQQGQRSKQLSRSPYGSGGSAQRQQSGQFDPPSRRITRSEGSFRSNATSDMHECGTVSVRILRGFNLINMDTGYRGDVSDPYVSIRLQSHGDQNRKRTHTIQNDLNPVWDTQPFLFPVTDIHDTVILEVWDENMLSEPDFLGKLEIPISYFNQADRINRGVQVREKLQGVDHGELLVEIGFSPD